MNQSIKVELRTIENGYVVDDSYFGDEMFFKERPDAIKEAKSRFAKWTKDQD